MSLKVNLEKTSNGVIKRVIDTNANGAGDTREDSTVYDFDQDESRDFESTKKFIEEILADLGIDKKGISKELEIRVKNIGNG